MPLFLVKTRRASLFPRAEDSSPPSHYEKNAHRFCGGRSFGRGRRTYPFAVPESCYAPFDAQLSTAAPALCSLYPPPAALAYATLSTRFWRRKMAREKCLICKGFSLSLRFCHKICHNTVDTIGANRKDYFFPHLPKA